MNKRNTFPFTCRALGLSTFEIKEREQGTDPDIWTRITMANLKAGDTLTLPKGKLDIVNIDEEAVNYRFTPSGDNNADEQTVRIDDENLETRALYIAIKTLLNGAHPDYTHPICKIIERDPAVHRLRSKKGWVIVGTRLALMTVNVQYPDAVSVKEERDITRSESAPEPEDSHIPDNNPQSTVTVTEEKQKTASPSQQQSSFDF